MGNSSIFGALIPLFTKSYTRGALEFKNFPSQEGVVPKSQIVGVPNPFHRSTGKVCALEWSSDGYVLAVGWTYGWGIFSVGGRCLASGFEVEDTLDESRCVRCKHSLNKLLTIR